MSKKKASFKPSKLLSGVLLMVIHAMSMSSVYVIGKKLTMDINPDQVAFLYKFSVLVAIIPWCFKGGIVHNLRTKKLGMHMARGIFSAAANLCFYHGLKYVRTADAAAITYLEQILVLILGVTYFKEKMSKTKLVAISCGIVGALFVIKPGFQEFNSNYIYIFLAIIFWAMNNFSVKVLGQTERTKTQLLYAMLFGSIFTFPFAMIHHWDGFHPGILKYVAVLAIFHLIHVVSFFRAFKYADISSVMPFDYTRLIFTGFLSYIFLKEAPDEIAMAGYIIIAIGGIYLICHESKKKGWSRNDEEQLKIDATLN